MNGDITSEALRQCQRASKVISPFIIMRPSSLGGGRILRCTLSVRLSVCLSVCPSVRLSVRPVSGCTLFAVAPSYERTSKIEKLRFSLMGQGHVCTFRHAQRAAYRTAISAAQILVFFAVFGVSFRRYKLYINYSFFTFIFAVLLSRFKCRLQEYFGHVICV